MTDHILQRLGLLSTAVISDALDKLRLNGALLGIKPLDPEFSMIGRAFTVSYRPAEELPGGTVGDYIDDVDRGRVVVLDNAGRPDCTVWGGLLTAVARSRGVAGTVVNGACRDTIAARTLGYPMFSLATYMRTGKDRVALSGVEVPISVGGVEIIPGDVVRGDSDGVVIIPQSRASDVLETAMRIESAESDIARMAENGCRLDEARSRMGYHALQQPT